MAKDLEKSGNQESLERFLYLVATLYRKREQILESSQKLIDYSYRIETCSIKELNALFTEVDKELVSIISCANELSPHLRNQAIVPVISDQAHNLTVLMTIVRNASGTIKPALSKQISAHIRDFAQGVNRTQISPTPKSIKTAYGIEVDIKQAKIKAFIERLVQYH